MVFYWWEERSSMYVSDLILMKTDVCGNIHTRLSFIRFFLWCLFSFILGRDHGLSSPFLRLALQHMNNNCFYIWHFNHKSYQYRESGSIVGPKAMQRECTVLHSHVQNNIGILDVECYCPFVLVFFSLMHFLLPYCIWHLSYKLGP